MHVQAELRARAILGEHILRPLEVSVKSAASAVCEELQEFYAAVDRKMLKWAEDWN